MEEEIIRPEQKETIKLTMGMKGTYGWEIKVVENKIDEDTIKHLEKIDLKLKEKFLGNSE